jgi:hypothetical protein
MTDESWAASVRNMVATTIDTVQNSNGQQVSVTRKVKDLHMGRAELETYINALLAKQQYRCALTGIKLQRLGEHSDIQILPSLDRIDSDGHYAKGNLQVVCRFVNGWKSDTGNAEFLRLLALVRNEEPVQRD